MLSTQAHGRGDDTEFDARVKQLRTWSLVTFGLCAGVLFGGICGLFVYANSRTPNVHDGPYIVIQSLGILIGLAFGYFAARNVDAQDDLLESSQRAATTLLRRYKPKAGTANHSNVGQRTIGPSDSGEEFLKTLLAKTP